MENVINLWISNWFYFIAAIDITLVVFIIIKWKQWNWLDRLEGLVAIVLILRVLLSLL
jgi:hypothetical protein